MWVIVGYSLVSLATLAVYGFDKHRAVHGGRRVSERTLHGLELMGGWPGALLGQAFFRHKRRKLSYMLVFLGIVGLHIMLWIAWFRLPG
jgi:uncharacterized membrane protein YsdA (DUF1294 family)